MQNRKLSNTFFYTYWVVVSIFAMYLIACTRLHTINALSVIVISIFSLIPAILYSMFLFAICVVDSDKYEDTTFEKDRQECRLYFIRELGIKTLAFRVSWMTLVNIVILSITGIVFWIHCIKNFNIWAIFYIILYIIYIELYKKYSIVTLKVFNWTDEFLGE